MNEEKSLLIQSTPAVKSLYQVKDFDPVRLLQKALGGRSRTQAEQMQIILKYKKLWFRLACPRGRILLTALRLTEEMAIIKADVFLDKQDTVPVANFTACRTIHNTPGGLYIQAAQYEAQDNALTDAGFGIQLCDVCKTWGEEAYTPNTDRHEKLPEADPTKEFPVQKRPDREVPEGEREQPSEVPSAEETHNEEQPTSEVPNGEIQEERSEGGTTAENAPVKEQPVAEERVEEQPVDGTITEEMAAGGDLPADGLITDGVSLVGQLPEGGKTVAPDVSDESNEGMSLETARSIIADVGMCRGQTLAQIGDRRPATLKWYFTSCTESSEQLRTAARIVFESLSLPQSA